MLRDVSLKSSSPKPTGNDFDIEDEPNIDKVSFLVSSSPKPTGNDLDIEDEPDIDEVSSLMSSSPKTTDNDFGMEEGSGIGEGSGNDFNLNLLLTSTVTLGGKCMELYIVGNLIISINQNLSSHSVLGILGEPCTAHLHVCKEAKE